MIRFGWLEIDHEQENILLKFTHPPAPRKFKWPAREGLFGCHFTNSFAKYGHSTTNISETMTGRMNQTSERT
jgi:hypothetical protein